MVKTSLGGAAVHFILQAMCFFHIGDSKKKKKKNVWVDGMVASSKFAERWHAQNLNNLLV